VLQGALCRYTEHVGPAQAPPTAVLLHGILGQRKNMGTFSKMLVEVRSMGATPQASQAMGPSLWGTICWQRAMPQGGCTREGCLAHPLLWGTMATHDGHP